MSHELLSKRKLTYDSGWFCTAGEERSPQAVCRADWSVGEWSCEASTNLTELHKDSHEPGTGCKQLRDQHSSALWQLCDGDSVVSCIPALLISAVLLIRGAQCGPWLQTDGSRLEHGCETAWCLRCLYTSATQTGFGALASISFAAVFVLTERSRLISS